MGRKALDITGQIFTRLKVIKRDFSFTGKATKWICLCDLENGGCGELTVVSAHHLKSGGIKSCGCLVKDKASTHGLSDIPEYNIWRHVKDRCRNDRNGNYKRYGGRGITMCDEWFDSFEAFYNDMGLRPGEGYSIERIENDKGYYKDNCKWATKQEQANNRSTSIFYTYKRVSKTLPAWCRELNLDFGLISCRIYQAGWSFEKAITTPKLK